MLDIVNALRARVEVFARLKSTAPDTTRTPGHWQQMAANHRALAPRLFDHAAHADEPPLTNFRSSPKRVNVFNFGCRAFLPSCPLMRSEDNRAGSTYTPPNLPPGPLNGHTDVKTKAKTYLGNPCRKCGGRERYTSCQGVCIRCTKLRSERRRLETQSKRVEPNDDWSLLRVID
jgi:hypothetical protein